MSSEIRNQIEFEIEFFRRVLARNPESVDVLQCLGEQLSAFGLHDEAVEIDRRLARLLPDDCIIHYNLGCSLARQRSNSEAIEELRKAFEYGYDDIGFLQTDRDLDSLRSEPAYQALLRDYGVEG